MPGYFFGRQTLHVAQDQRRPLTGAQKAQSILQIISMFAAQQRLLRALRVAFRSELISQNEARPLRRMKSIAVLVAILDSQ